MKIYTETLTDLVREQIKLTTGYKPRAITAFNVFSLRGPFFMVEEDFHVLLADNQGIITSAVHIPYKGALPAKNYVIEMDMRTRLDLSLRHRLEESKNLSNIGIMRYINQHPEEYVLGYARTESLGHTPLFIPEDVSLMEEAQEKLGHSFHALVVNVNSPAANLSRGHFSRIKQIASERAKGDREEYGRLMVRGLRRTEIYERHELERLIDKAVADVMRDPLGNSRVYDSQGTNLDIVLIERRPQTM